MHHLSTSHRARAVPRAAAVLGAVLALTLVGCGTGADAGSEVATAETTTETAPSAAATSPPEAAFPVTVASGQLPDTTELTIAEQPQAIVSLSATATEMLWAVGAGEQVVAVDDQSDYPAGVPTTTLSGFEPNVEAILGYEPDLVVISDDPGDLVSSLDKAKVPTLVMPAAADLDEAYSQIERIGAATGHVAEAAETVASIESGLDKIVADAPQPATPKTYYHELDPTLFSVTGDTFIGEVYGLFGLTNIADEATGDDLYPQLSEEFVVTADPDLIYLADAECCGVTAEQVAARPGWDGITAVRDGRITPVDEDVASRWGPRVVDFAAAIGKSLSVVSAAG